MDAIFKLNNMGVESFFEEYEKQQQRERVRAEIYPHRYGIYRIEYWPHMQRYYYMREVGGPNMTTTIAVFKIKK